MYIFHIEVKSVFILSQYFSAYRNQNTLALVLEGGPPSEIFHARAINSHLIDPSKLARHQLLPARDYTQVIGVPEQP